MLCKTCSHSADDHNYFMTLIDYWEEKWTPCNVHLCFCKGFRPSDDSGLGALPESPLSPDELSVFAINAGGK